MKARLIHEVGTRADLIVYWEGSAPCPHGGGWHRAECLVAKSDVPEDWDLGGHMSDYLDDCWPSKCDGCGATALPFNRDPAVRDLSRFSCRTMRHAPRWDTASGNPEPGDLYWRACKYTVCQWDNCDGKPHLIAVLPNGMEWQIDGRANNCTLPNDKIHRCWVRTGEPPNITVGKGGLTCAAGAGSILCGDYHGFLRGGAFT